MYIRSFSELICVVLLYCTVVKCSDPYTGSTGNEGIWDYVSYFVSHCTRIVGIVGEAFSSSLDEECEFKCANGAKPQRNIYHKPVGNGCGTPGLGITIPKYVPLQRLEKCCEEHDICYGTCHNHKESCDKEFKACLYNICSSIQKIVSDSRLQMGCKGVAKGLYLTVLAGGCKYYLDAQEEACLCDLDYYNEL